MTNVIRAQAAATSLLLLFSASGCADQARIGTNSCADGTGCMQYNSTVRFEDGGVSTRAADLTVVTPEVFAELPELSDLSAKELEDAKLTEGADGSVWAAVGRPTLLQVTLVDKSGQVVKTTRIEAPGDTSQVTVQSATKLGDGLLVVANWINAAQSQELLLISARGDVRRMPFARQRYGDALGAIPSDTDDEFLMLYIGSIARMRASGVFVWEKGFGSEEAITQGPGRFISTGEFALQLSIAPDRSGIFARASRWRATRASSRSATRAGQYSMGMWPRTAPPRCSCRPTVATPS